MSWLGARISNLFVYCASISSPYSLQVSLSTWTRILIRIVLVLYMYAHWPVLSVCDTLSISILNIWWKEHTMIVFNPRCMARSQRKQSRASLIHSLLSMASTSMRRCAGNTSARFRYSSKKKTLSPTSSIACLLYSSGSPFVRTISLVSLHTTYWLHIMATLSTIANVFGVITPAKDVIEVVKSIADSIEEVRISYLNVFGLKPVESNRWSGIEWKCST